MRQQTVTVKFFESKVHRYMFTEKLEKNYWEEWIVPLQVPSATVATVAPVCVGFLLVGRRRRRRRLLQVAPTRRPMLRGGGGGASDDAEARARADRLSAELRDRMRVRFAVTVTHRRRQCSVSWGGVCLSSVAGGALIHTLNLRR
eukprot:COSAG01_NODE_7774_length_3063_cov_2.191970_8_plen_145_part_00